MHRAQEAKTWLPQLITGEDIQNTKYLWTWIHKLANEEGNDAALEGLGILEEKTVDMFVSDHLPFPPLGQARKSWPHFKGDSQFKAGPPLPPGFTSTSMPPQKKKIIFGSVFAFFSHFFWGANSEWGFPTSMPPAEKFFIFDSIITLFRPFFFWDELGVGFSCLSNDRGVLEY